MALEGGEWLAACPGCTLLPGKTRYPFYMRLGGPQGRSGRAANLVPTGIRSRTVQPVVSRYNDRATRPTMLQVTHKICDTSCFSIAKMVTQIRLTVISTLPVLSHVSNNSQPPRDLRKITTAVNVSGTSCTDSGGGCFEHLL